MDIEHCRKNFRNSFNCQKTIVEARRKAYEEMWGKSNNTTMQKEDILKDFNALDKYEYVIFEYSDKLIDQFFKYKDIGDIISCRFGSNSVEIIYYLNSGQHIVDSIDLEKFIEFFIDNFNLTKYNESCKQLMETHNEKPT
jgi:hypothetical protein